MTQNTEGSDGIEDVIEGQLRVLVSAAAMAGEQLARQRERDLRQAEAVSLQQAREAQSRIEAERRAMHAELASITRGDWWESASPQDIAGAYELAAGWAADDQVADRAQQRITDELLTRHGISVEELRTQVADAAQIAAAAYQRQRAAEEAVEAQRLLAMAAAEDRARAENTPVHDVDPWELAEQIRHDDPQVADLAREYLLLEGLALREGVGDTSEPADRQAALERAEQLRAEQEQVNADLAAMRADFAALETEQWWESATPEQIAQVHEHAQQWAPDDAGARRAQQHIAEQLQQLHGMTVDELTERVTSRHTRHQADADRTGEPVPYDSPERRKATAEELRAKGIDQKAIQARMRADAGQARPATDATRQNTQGTKSRAPKARRTRQRTAQSSRTGLTR